MSVKMDYKSIKELSITYLESIGFKHNDHVIVLFKNGDIQYGKLNFNNTFIELKPTEKIIILMYNALALCHLNIIKSQAELYDIENTYKVTFEIVGIKNQPILGYTPRKIFNTLKLLKPDSYLNMDIDIVNKTIKIFPCSSLDNLHI